MKPVLSASILALLAWNAGCAIAAPGAPGRLFYTPAQRAQLEAARNRGTRVSAASPRTAVDTPQRYDGVLIRSDGQVTHWIDGTPAPAAPRRLQPGQTRASGRVYEAYQLLSPAQPAPAEEAQP